MRAATATIDLTALRHNLERVRALAQNSQVLAVVKANGYGHGAARLLPALDSANALGVACIEEALALREAGASRPILLLEGIFEASELELCCRYGLQIVVHHVSQVEMLEQARLPRPIPIWLNIDSGMHRLGFQPDQVKAVWQRLQACGPVASGIRLMSHFAHADDLDDPVTREQLAVWQATTAGLPGERSLANSAGVLGWPQAHLDWVRPGVMLYGVSPMKGWVGTDERLRPVMTLSTRLIAVKRLKKRDAVGYGGTWVCPEDMPVGIAAIGYGDGYPRHAPSGTPVLVNGQRVGLAGQISMDMIGLDLRNQPQAQVGDPVTLWGEGLPIEEVANHAGTIAYELLCGVTQRVHVKVVDGSQGASILQ